MANNSIRFRNIESTDCTSAVDVSNDALLWIRLRDYAKMHQLRLHLFAQTISRGRYTTPEINNTGKLVTLRNGALFMSNSAERSSG